MTPAEDNEVTATEAIEVAPSPAPRRGRPPKVDVQPAEEAPSAEPAPAEAPLVAEEVVLSPQTLAEMEAGRRALFGK